MSAMNPYRTLRQFASDEFIINKSRFIGYAAPCETEAEALAFLQSIRTKHKDATHNCYAYIIGQNAGIMRYSDDGEPAKTAGTPALEVLQHSGLTDLIVVITRYFGGVLLGAGGLTRAYTKGAKDVLDAVGIAAMSLWTLWDVPCTYPLLERMKLEVAAAGGVIRDAEYGADITLRTAFPAGTAETFQLRLTELSAGSLTMTAAGEEFLPGPREEAN